MSGTRAKHIPSSQQLGIKRFMIYMQVSGMKSCHQRKTLDYELVCDLHTVFTIYCLTSIGSLANMANSPLRLTELQMIFPPYLINDWSISTKTSRSMPIMVISFRDS